MLRLIALFLLVSGSALAQFRDDIVIRKEVAPEYAKVIVAEYVAREENKGLSTVNDEMINNLLSTISGKYIKKIKADRDAQLNILSLSGEIKDRLKYTINRNIRNTFAAYTVINSITSFENIQDLDNENIPLSEVKIENFNNEPFLIYNNDKDKKTFIEGNIGAQINIQVQTIGEGHFDAAMDFIYSLDFEKIKEALLTGEYPYSLEDFEKAVNKNTENKELVQKLLEGKI